MPLKDVVKVSRKTFFYPSGWLGVGMLKSQTRMLWGVLKNVFTPEQAHRTETFEQAMQRLKLTESDIQKTAQKFFMFSMIFLICGLLTIGFSAYLLFYHGTFAGLILGLATTAVFFSYAFRFSFWRFQIRHRKLGCTFKEWLHGKPIAGEDSGHD